MSLQVWLPLNGNLNNQGLSNISVTNNGATVDNNGKIGKCYKCSGDSRISFPSFDWMTMKPNNNFSFFFWAKGTTNGWLFACSAWEFILRPGYIQIHLAGNGQYPARYTSTFDTNTWYHLGFTWSGTDGKLLLYLNGSKVAESDVPSTANFDISSTFNLPYDGPRYLNDVRIYNHTLSAKEVKELSKGLVLHYRLAGSGQGNLLSRYVAPGQPSSPNSTSAGGRTIYYGDYGIKIPASENADTYFSLYLSKQLTQGNIYTISCEVENLLNGTSYNFPLFAQGNTSMGVLKLDHNGLCSLTFTMNGSSQSSVTTSSGETVYKCFMDDSGRSIASGQSNTPIIVKNFKIEEGPVATPWTPNSTDSLYLTLGYNSTTEFDCSGYGRNGTKSGTITCDSDTPRYTTSYKFGSTSTKIKLPTMTYSNFGNSYTFSWWQKNTSSGNMPWGFSDGNRLNLYHTTNLCWNTGDGSNNPFKDSNGNALSQSKLCDSTWHHCAIVGNGSSTILYIDGVKAGTATTYKPLTGTQIYISGWDSGTSYTFNGSNLVDFRIYSIALSEADIKELYNTSFIVDNSGKSYAYEYIEK